MLVLGSLFDACSITERFLSAALSIFPQGPLFSRFAKPSGSDSDCA